jgi:hypothetical protein
MVICPAAGAGAIERKQVRRRSLPVPEVMVWTCCHVSALPVRVGVAGGWLTNGRVLATKASTSVSAPGWMTAV